MPTLAATLYHIASEITTRLQSVDDQELEKRPQIW